ncbi:MAG: hypothetical protein CVU71_05650 [Deltaproteobacteria bacterium HGW-Deltaproteobacteria-6]|jgi:hypothetical protein|nr:MAG: hypothetical protein CVU71_05650 [Deltaproteobacteria bacterium HGW-Deltaproteobacteria-6]
MDHKKTAKQLMDLNTTVFHSTSNTTALRKETPESFFFSFIDKNPLFQDNSKEAIHEYLLASHKRRFAFQTHVDEGNEKVPDYLMRSHFHYGNK